MNESTGLRAVARVTAFAFISRKFEMGIPQKSRWIDGDATFATLIFTHEDSQPQINVIYEQPLIVLYFDIEK